MERVKIFADEDVENKLAGILLKIITFMLIMLLAHLTLLSISVV